MNTETTTTTLVLPLREAIDKQKSRIINYRIVDNSMALIFEENGSRYLIPNVKIRKIGSHIILTDFQNQTSLTMPLAYDQARRRAMWAITALVGALIVSAVSTMWFHFPKHEISDTLQKRLLELDGIKRSITEVEDYVTDQQNQLKLLVQSTANLRQEKENLENITALKRNQVQALLQYKRPIPWLSHALSYLIGVLSSISASLVLRALALRKKKMATLIEK